MWCYDSAAQVLVYIDAVERRPVFAITRNELEAMNYKADVLAMHRLPRPQIIMQQLQAMR